MMLRCFLIRLLAYLAGSILGILVLAIWDSELLFNWITLWALLFALVIIVDAALVWRRSSMKNGKEREQDQTI
jgi:uncharacterized membrane protein YfcA